MATFGLNEPAESLLVTSADYDSMYPYWERVDDIAAGVERLRQKSSRYLPPFPAEKEASYRYRNQNSVLIDIFGDVVESLAAKPFTKEAGLYDDTPPAAFGAMVENINRSGDHLHVFAQSVFYNGIAYGMDWVLVDHTRVPAGATLADEQRLGARPYLVRIAARDMLEVRSDVDKGEEVFVFVRINESYTAPDGTPIDRVRLLIRDPIVEEYMDDGVQRTRVIGYSRPRFEVWEAKESAPELIDAGPITLPVIPLVPFYTGRRESGTWRFTLPMKRIIDLQFEHYQAATNLKIAKEQTCFPMLVGEGVKLPEGESEIPIGPAGLLVTPMGQDGRYGEWKWLEPSTESLMFLASEVRSMESTMRELGRMPLAANSAGITNIAASMASERSNSAAQSWVFTLKDVLEKALGWCAQWIGSNYEPEVLIDTDFAVELTEATEPALLKSMAMPDSGQPPLMSMGTFYSELKRRGILAPEVNATKEKALLEQEAQFKQEMFERYPNANTTARRPDADRRIGEASIYPDENRSGGE